MEIALRAYNKLVTEREQYKGTLKHDMPNFDEVLCWDTETTIDDRKSLRVGVFIRKNIKHNIVTKMGIFYNPEEITDKELQTIRNFWKKHPLYKIYTVKEFVEQILFPASYIERIPIIAFNICFDASRISLGYGLARKQFKGGFVFTLSDDEKWPRLRLKHIATNETIIEYCPTIYSSFKGFFVDCATLASIMQGEKRISLKTACDRYNKIYFKTEEEHGEEINEKYLKYCENDVLCTLELFTHLKTEYERFNISLPITRVFSGASIAKGVLAELGIMPMDLSDINPQLIGKIAQTFTGGLCSLGVRKQNVLVDALDFTNNYPSINLILGLYEFLICEKIAHYDDTENVKNLINSINTIDDLKNVDIYKNFAIICELLPQDDPLPTRARYGDNFTVASSYVTSREPIYYCLPSLLFSKLKTGRTPELKSAIRFIPVGRQKTLRKATILGIEMDPATDNIFKILVEERLKSKKAKDGREILLKQICNILSYGLYFEVNKENFKSNITVYSGNESFPEYRRYERQGKYFNAVLAALITDTSKLFLGLGELIVQQQNKGNIVAYQDTDSLYLTKNSIDDPISSHVISFFDFLNPYDKNLVPHFLKMEEENIYLYAISAKRYVLNSVDKKGNFIIKDDNYSLHGLGHLLSPFGDDVKWEKEVWIDVLKLDCGDITMDQFLSKYRDYYPISKFTISTASLMRRFRVLNKGKSYNDMIKPFNWFWIGYSNDVNVKPIVPSTDDPQSMPHSPFINYKDGKIMKGQHYFKTLDDEMWDYINHPESKMDGDIGVLKRKHVVVDKIVYIGKESDKIEEHLSGLSKVNYNIYRNPKHILSKILSLSWEEAQKAGFSKSQYHNMISNAKKGRLLNSRHKTLEKLGFL